MIFDAFLYIAVYILSWLVEKLPTGVGFGAEFHTAVSSLGGYVEMWKPLFPMDTIATLVSLIVIVELSIFAFKTAKWIISHIPFIGGSR